MKPNDKVSDAFRIAKLLERHVKQGRLTEGEQAEIARWIAASEGNRELFERISDEHQLAFALMELQDTDTEHGLAKAHGRIRRAGQVRTLRRLLGAAAAVLVFVAVGLGVHWYADNEKPLKESADLQDDVGPGGNRATLTLADGRVLDLNDAQTGIVIGESIKYRDGSDVLAGMQTEELQLVTPRGGTYQVTLADGTEIWLNAASSLTYPARFVDHERVVQLVGEAYFSVAKDDGRPFRVMSGGQEIEVLGTEFNVSAYSDDAAAKTTLVEGAVQIRHREAKTVNRLSPGQQAILQTDGLLIKDVDVGPFVAWKEGYFHFDGTPFADMMLQLGRWYDIELVYEGARPSQTFTGKMSRNVSLMNVMRFFKGSGIDFRLSGRTLVIEGPNS